MSKRILAWIATIWGALIIIRGVITGFAQQTSESYRLGQVFAYIVGALMLIAGLHYLLKNRKKSSA
jgi:uncharacterized membrane protein HdeD (DUF308 family)